MAIYVYISDKCGKDAIAHACVPELNRFKAQLEQRQLIFGFHNFPHPFLVRKKFAQYQLRLISSAVNFDDHTLLYFHEIIVRGSLDYARFQENTDSYFDRHYDEEKAAVYIQQRVEADRPVPVPVPSVNEHAFLFESHLRSSFEGDFFICESSRWVDDIMVWQSCLSEIFRKLGLEKWSISGERTIELDGGAILLRSFPACNKVFLAGIGEMHRLDDLREKYADIFLEDDARITEETILRNSLRSYTEYMFAASLSDWVHLEKERNANLAMSFEEVQVMESTHASMAGQSGTGFPLFINGRAGSGKSTVLQYIFANYLYYYIKHVQQHGGANDVMEPPQFFSYSADLIKTSTSLISSLLQNKAIHDNDKAGMDTEQLKPILYRSIRVFKEHLYSLLPDCRPEAPFAMDQYVNYSRFRKLWHDRFRNVRGAERYFNADISWHIIRTYIKGYNEDFLLTPEEYEEIPRRMRTVSREIYNRVYTSVWENWYKQTDWWDDQDLSRYLLSQDLIKPVFPGIFCDEAQDFTRIELELVRRMCLFSKRKLDFNTIRSIPLAFAGDQFQTLNPSGFRWDQTKAAFYEKLIANIDPGRNKLRPEINFKELRYNYRSGERIVNFTNSIQFLRSVLFCIDDVDPQLYWGDDASPLPPMLFNIDADRDRLKKSLVQNEELTIILPCLEGEETEYVEQDEFLRSFINTERMTGDKNEKIAHRVYSPERIKGLEEEQIVVYGFGGHVPPSLFSSVNGEQQDEQRLQNEYFMNRLYVAVSRPRKKLFIIDTAAGIQLLWHHFCSTDNLNAVMRPHLRNEPDIGKWSEKCDYIEYAEIDTLAESIVDPVESARVKMQRGIGASDPYFLYQASISYANAALNDKYLDQKSELQKKSREARARALFIEEKFREAAEHFLEAERYEDAVRSWWHLISVEGWEKIVSCASVGSDADRKSVASLLEFTIARFMLNRNRNIQDYLGLFLTAKDQTLYYRSRFLEDPSWEKVFTQITDDITVISEGEPGVWLRITNYIDEIEATGIRIMKPRAKGDLYYKAGEYKKAIAIYDRYNIKNEEYWKCILAVKNYPDTLQAFFELGEYSQIIAAYNTDPERELKGEQLQYIVSGACRQGDVKLAEQLFAQYTAAIDDIPSFADLALQLKGSFQSDRGFAVATGRKLLDRFVALDRERAAVALTYGLNWNDDGGGEGIDFSKIGLQLYQEDLELILVDILKDNETSIKIGPYEVWTILLSLSRRNNRKYLQKTATLFVRMCIVKHRLEILPALLTGQRISFADNPEKKDLAGSLKELQHFSPADAILFFRRAFVQCKHRELETLERMLKLCRHLSLVDAGSIVNNAVMLLFDLAANRGFVPELYPLVNGKSVSFDNSPESQLDAAALGFTSDAIGVIQDLYAESVARFGKWYRQYREHTEYHGLYKLLEAYAIEKKGTLDIVLRARLYELFSGNSNDLLTYYEEALSGKMISEDETWFYTYRLIVNRLRFARLHREHGREAQAVTQMEKARRNMQVLPLPESAYDIEDYPVRPVALSDYLQPLRQGTSKNAISIEKKKRPSRKKHKTHARYELISENDFSIAQFDVRIKERQNRIRIEHKPTGNELNLEIIPLTVVDAQVSCTCDDEICRVKEWGLRVCHYRNHDSLRFDFSQENIYKEFRLHKE